MRRDHGRAPASALDLLSEIDDRIREVGDALDPSLDVSPVLKLSLESLEKEAKRAREALEEQGEASAEPFADLRQAIVSARNAAALDTGVPRRAVRSLDELLKLVHGADDDQD